MRMRDSPVTQRHDNTKKAPAARPGLSVKA
jgi:hypothetical protein